MITLFSMDDTRDKPHQKTALKKPTLWIILAAAVLAVTAAVIFLPDALKQPVGSEASNPPGSENTQSEPSVSEQLKLQMSNLLSDDIGFQFLGSADGVVTDAQMAAYAVLKMENYSYEPGNTREEYDTVTLKHFGKKITDYTKNGMTEAVPGTDRIRAVGWGYEENYYALPGTLTQTGENRYVGQFYCIHAPYSFDDGWNYTDEQTKSMLYEGNWEPFVQYGRTFNLVEVTFTVGHEADGAAYPIYESVKLLQTDLTGMPVSNAS